MSGGMPASGNARHRAEVEVVAAVAEQLGNTPAVCRTSCVDPRILDRFESGATIAGARNVSIEGGPVDQPRKIERQVIRLLDETRQRPS